MAYKIVVEFLDGNSFGSYEDRDEIPYEWEDLEHCQAAAALILETSKRGSATFEKYTVTLPLDGGVPHEFQNFWNAEYFQALVSVEIQLAGQGKVYA